jgi:hypothetical protein
MSHIRSFVYEAKVYDSFKSFEFKYFSLFIFKIRKVNFRRALLFGGHLL